MSLQQFVPRARRLCRAVLVRTAVLATAAGALVGLQHQQATELGRAESVAVTSRQIAVPSAPMGWASWNTFAAKIDYNVIKSQVDAFVAAGMPEAGYEYINLDEGWWQGTRDSQGNITIDEAEWPGGMKAIADYIHSKGLKAGIYTDAGKDGCGYYFPTGRPAAPGSGSEGHYEQDMLQFSKWGFDYVKVDWCGGDVEGLDAKSTYQAISDAAAKATATTGRELKLSICNWGKQNPWNWGAGMAALWRTNTDIIFHGNSPSWNSMLTNFDTNVHPSAQHTGYYNDPDMLMVGLDGFTAAQNRSHMNLWAVSGAPLLAGNNLTTMSTQTRDILTNPEVIAVDQDPRGLQGVKVAEDAGGLQVYGKVLSGTGKRAVVLLNRTGSAQNMTVRWSDLGLTNASATVRNLWTRSNVGSFGTSYTVNVPARDSVMLTVTGGTEAASSTYEAEAGANTKGGSAVNASCANCSGGTKVGGVGNGSANTLRFNNVTVGATGTKVVDIAYTNGSDAARTAVLKVNGQQATTVSFPPTGSWTTPGTVSVEVSLAKGSSNTLTFSNSSAWTPDFDAIEVRPLPGANGARVVGQQSNRCLDINNNTITNGTDAQLWDCHGGENQSWNNTSRKELVVYGNKCLDAYNRGTTNGTRVVIWDCNGQTNQQWNVNADGTITNVNGGLCLDSTSAGTANGTKLVLWTCNGGNNQKWTLS
ncbi:alpha-galactosidase D [Streptomyces resistomycificus]|uniref:Alpha-galactosidase n=1 Tax=Streptomyces resistomycificus TaxID=67356 RepID=A0A0L8LGI4_9ACTN|nr:ricin-type beta-trefoil lectin domain protein [Streptomyces resistomycificus]KOG37230.1 alpha-galactosidase [Streptomyces resistomycificus]KUN95188.1 alpha-galactosidase [Streptomyces resistomycificus]